MSGDPLPENSSRDKSQHGSASRFETTRWSVILAAGQVKTPYSAAAMQSLCQSYWHPLYAYARRRVTDVNEAQDLTQAFFAELLEKNYVDAATPSRGRFRAFLLTAFKHFLSKQWGKARAQKRGGGRTPLSIDFDRADARYGIEPSAGLTPEQLYDRQWAVTLLEQVMAQLAEEYADRGKGELFQRIKDFAIGDHAGARYAHAAASLGMSEAAAKMAAHRLRQRYRQLLREQIAQTVATPQDVDAEIRELFALFASQ
ncbi:MAG: RNA polymerase sigma factor [Pirellulaceae bacterium]